MKIHFALLLLCVVNPGYLAAAPMQDYLQQLNISDADPLQGKNLWQTGFIKDGKTRSCTSCHGLNPAEPGKHERTGKPIQPMAPSVNNERLTDIKKIEKWFKRNCKWTLGRECTVREKANILRYLSEL